MSSRDFAALLSEPEPEPRLASVGAEPNGSSSVQLDLDAALRLWLRRGESPIRVKPVRCFPWSAPGELVSLRDEGGHEQLLVERLQDLDTLSARALETALLGSGFVLDVQRVESIEEDYEIRLWQTETRHGRRTFQTKLDEWPWASPDGGYLVRDLAGDLFRIPALEALDERSRALLWAYVG
jgi:hypothetical protein